MRDTWISEMNEWGQARVPFLFIIDFEMEKPIVIQLSEAGKDIQYDFNGFTNVVSKSGVESVDLQFDPLPFVDYAKKFDLVMNGLLYGNSFLTNLTLATPVSANGGALHQRSRAFDPSMSLPANIGVLHRRSRMLDAPLSLRDIFHSSKAPFRMWKANDFVFFSPERFIRIENGMISTNPMKGTIDACIPDAGRLILDDRKELAEHITIVDLLRNDLSIVADDVEVNRFRYIDTIRTYRGELLQVSSEISGKVRKEFQHRYGDMLLALLPAGSVSGAPKASTLQIIRAAEIEKRGYYTGVAGYFDGTHFDSCVMIRFIEATKNGLRYRSGGGITTQSDPVSEYNEVVKKIYVPVA
jgi:para-aminobenzoate synthetase component 1